MNINTIKYFCHLFDSTFAKISVHPLVMGRERERETEIARERENERERERKREGERELGILTLRTQAITESHHNRVHDTRGGGKSQQTPTP